VERGNTASALTAAGRPSRPHDVLCRRNIGNGPGWWVVVFSALLSTGAWFAFWVAIGRLNAWHEAVAVDRDVATGIRIGAWLAAMD